jgi:hypothetical protein
VAIGAAADPLAHLASLGISGLSPIAAKADAEGRLPVEAGARDGAKIALAARAGAPFEVRDARSGVTVRVSLEGARDVRGEVRDGLALYRGALEAGDVVQRAGPYGTEDYALLAHRPEQGLLRYRLELGVGAAGLRLIGPVLEVLDANGTPRLRVRAPWVVDAAARRSRPGLHVEGCAFDDDPRAPWGRTPVAPGRASCGVVVRIDESVRYPAVVDPAWEATSAMIAARSNHVSSTLASGRVLIAGGYGLSSAELFDPATATFSATGSMAFARGDATATALASGLVVVIGGTSNADRADVYDPATGTFSLSANATASPRFYGRSALLPSGKILVSGGKGEASAEIYDPATRSFGATASMKVARAGHALTTLPASSPKRGFVVATGGTAVASAELFDPVSQTWTLAPGMMADWRAFHAAYALADGTVLVAGGRTSSPTGTISAERFDPVGGTFLAAAPLHSAQFDAFGATAGAKFLFIGNGASAEVFDPSTSAWKSVGPHLVARNGPALSALLDGRVLISGGDTAAPSAEIFDPTTPVFAANGASCTSPAECASSFCVDGVCCERACTEACFACASRLTFRADGTCAATSGGLDPHGDCGSTPGACVGPYCDGAGRCKPAPAGTTCGKSACSAGVAQDAPACDFAGTCVAGASSPCPSGICAGDLCGVPCASDADCGLGQRCTGGICFTLRANGAACATATECVSKQCVDGVCCSGASCVHGCATDLDCLPGRHCQSGVCLAGPANGAACAADAECGSGHCVDGVCCDGACDGQCEACDLVSSRGQCTAVFGAPRGARSPCAGSGAPCDAVCDGWRRYACHLPGASRTCGDYRCDGAGACFTGCDSDAKCAEGLVCSDGACVAGADVAPQTTSCAFDARRPTSPERLAAGLALAGLLAAWRRARACRARSGAPEQPPA